MLATMTGEKYMPYRLNIIDDAMSLLMLLFESDRRMNLSELALACGMTKNKAFRLLKNLELQGILDKDTQGRFYFGIKTFFAARHALTRIDIPEVFPFLENIALRLNEDVYFARKTTELPLLVAVANSRQLITVRSCIGCVLRDQGSEKTRELVRVSVGALDPEVTTVAIDLPVYRERESNALVVVAPTFRLPLERVQTEVIPVLRETVRQLGQLEAESIPLSLMRGGTAGCVRRAPPRTVRSGQKLAG